MAHPRPHQHFSFGPKPVRSQAPLRSWWVGLTRAVFEAQCKVEALRMRGQSTYRDVVGEQHRAGWSPIRLTAKQYNVATRLAAGTAEAEE